MRFHQAADTCLPAEYHAAQILSYARDRELDDDLILRGSDLIAEHITQGLCRISPQQYLQLLGNALQALRSADSSFMLGQQMLPGHFGSVSHALLQAQNLRQALDILCMHATRLCPLLKPRYSAGQDYSILYWMDSYGAPSLRPAIVEMHMTAVVAMCRWLSGRRLPWRFCFNRSAARHTEQHEVHLGGELRFNCHLDAMLIASEYLDLPWPRGNALAANLALQQARQEALLMDETPSLLNAVYDYLLAHIRCSPSLEQLAAAFGVSPASMKRYLARQGTHFQAELDQVRTHVALYLFQSLQYDNEAVAHHLGFHDANNFRRSFKRWTGVTPSLLKEKLADDFPGLSLHALG
ncbi:AraC family transcriptional regulator [Undibacterium sp.]|uniref:AraC family transcriptional regulator n=1 Tax=Undibacterium sp. TaxID=1914977 RepID=UPI00272F3C18|nr:AraC family transcriptional regulator [Undibacterium sp.]MDP1977059.1 AraC family transcriptional regulator ligand-binding domain-containing protein [Undibacterium sp.]